MPVGSEATPTNGGGPSTKELRLKVYARVRPPHVGELGGSSGAHNVIHIVDRSEVGNPSSTAAAGLDDASSQHQQQKPDGAVAVRVGSKLYSFDQVFDGGASNSAVGGVAADPLVDHALSGFNATVMCYGQTGTGKTYTMSHKDQGDVGILFRSIQHVFAACAKKEKHEGVKAELRFTYVQLYRDNLQDLLDPETPYLKLRKFDPLASGEAANQFPSSADGPVRAPDGPIAATTWSAPLSSYRQFVSLYDAADRNRVVAETQMNKASSRGHSVLALHIALRQKKQRAPPRSDFDDDDDIMASLERNRDRYSRLVFVDLAGYERLKKTNLTDPIRMDEARAINLSLTALANVIHSLTYGAKHVPWRNSKLTQVLQSSIAGNSVTSVVLALGPSSVHLTETLNTLHFGHNAIQCKTAVTVNVSSIDYRDAYEQLLGQVEKLKRRQPERAEPEVVERVVERERVVTVEADTTSIEADLSATKAQVSALESRVAEQDAYIAESDEILAAVDDEARELQKRCDAAEREAAAARRAIDSLLALAGRHGLATAVASSDDVKAYMEVVGGEGAAVADGQSDSGSPLRGDAAASDLQRRGNVVHGGGGGGGSIAVSGGGGPKSGSNRFIDPFSPVSKSGEADTPSPFRRRRGRSSEVPPTATPPSSDGSSSTPSSSTRSSSSSTTSDSSPSPRRRSRHHRRQRRAASTSTSSSSNDDTTLSDDADSSSSGDPPPPPPPRHPHGLYESSASSSSASDDGDDGSSPSSPARENDDDIGGAMDFLRGKKKKTTRGKSTAAAAATSGSGGHHKNQEGRQREGRSDQLPGGTRLLRWRSPSGFDPESLLAWLPIIGRAAAAVDAEEGATDDPFATAVLCTAGDVHRFITHLVAVSAVAAAMNGDDRLLVPGGNAAALTTRWWHAQPRYLHRVLLSCGLGRRGGAAAIPDTVVDAVRQSGIPPLGTATSGLYGEAVGLPESVRNSLHSSRFAGVDLLAEAGLWYDDGVPRVVGAALSGSCVEGETIFLHVTLSAGCAALAAATSGPTPNEAADDEDDDDDELNDLGPSSAGIAPSSSSPAAADRVRPRGTIVRWYRVQFDGGSEQSEASVLVAEGCTSYRCATADVGCVLLAEIEPCAALVADNDGDNAAATANAPPRFGPATIVRSAVPVVSLVPHVESLRIGGDTYLGETLFASYKFKGGSEGRSVVRWYRSLDGQRFTQFATSRAPDRTLRVTADLVHHYIRVQVTPVRRDEVKGNVVVSKLVYVNVPPSVDSELTRQVAHVASGGVYAAPLAMCLPPTKRHPQEERVRGELRFDRERMSFAPDDAAVSTSQRARGIASAPPTLQWAACGDRAVVYVILSSGKGEADLVWLEAMTSCGGAAPGASSSSTGGGSSPVAALLAADSWQTRDFVILLYRALFALSVPGAVTQLTALGAAARDASRAVAALPLGRVVAGSAQVFDRADHDTSKAVVALTMEAARTAHAGSTVAFQRPGSEGTGVAVLEECSFGFEDSSGRRLSGGGGGASSSGTGEPPRLGLVVPNLPGVFF